MMTTASRSVPGPGGLAGPGGLRVLLLLSWVVGAFPLQDVTAALFGAENRGTVAAFGDFNSDKQTDLFIIRNRKNPLEPSRTP